MTALSIALQAAGVPTKPMNERVWLWLRDHPRTDAKAVGAALSLSGNLAYSTLHELENRGMVTTDLESRRCKVAKGYGTRQVKVYSTIGTVWERLPIRKKSATSAPPTLPPRTSPDVRLLDRAWIASLTVADARRLYDELGQYFAPESGGGPTLS